MSFDAVDQKFGFTPKKESQCMSCGVECDSYPVDGTGAICPKCCPDHDYIYDSGMRTHICKTCGQEPPYDWYEVDE